MAQVLVSVAAVTRSLFAEKALLIWKAADLRPQTVKTLSRNPVFCFA